MRMIPEWMDVVCSTSQAATALLQPQDVDEGDGVHARELRRKHLQAPVRQDAMTAGTTSIVHGDPHGVPQSLAEIAEPALHLAVGSLAPALLIDALTLALSHLTDAVQIGLPGGQQCGVSARWWRRVAP